MASTARFITSGLMGVAKSGGSVVFPMGFPSRSKIFAVFFGGIVFHRYFPWGDCSDMYVICGGSSGVALGGRAG